MLKQAIAPCALASFLAVQAAPLLAQTAESPAGQSRESLSNNDDIEEITVTARKRKESLLQVPDAITALTQQQLEQFQTHDLYVLADRVPGLLIGNNIGVLGPDISLRGVGASAQEPTVEQSVSLNLDGLPLSQSFAFQAGMFDVGQLEVMKGPQALFFGKNSPAGVISLRSADPTEQTEIIARAGYEAVAQEKLGEVILSGPVAPWLKLRLALHYSTDDGYFENLDTAPAGFGVRTPTTSDFAANQDTVVRLTALLNPSDIYDARVKFNYTHDFSNYGGGDLQVANCPNGKTSFTGLPVFDQNEDCTLNRHVYDAWFDPQSWPLAGHDGIPYVASHQVFGTVEQNLHLGQFTATSVTGYYDMNQAALVNGSVTSGVITVAANNDFANRQVTEEARLTSNFEGPLNVMLGGFYQNGDQMNHPRVLGATAVGLPSVLADVRHDINIKSLSGFGQVIWSVTRQLELAGGARWTHETRDHTQYNVATPGVPVGPTVLLDPHLSSTNTSPEATLTFRPTEDLTVYGAYKQGFKSGSFDTAQYFGPTTGASFGDESVKGYEVGLKTRMLDRRLSVNLAGYYYHYAGLQVGANTSTPDGGFALTTLNAATANVSGMDLDITYDPPEVQGLSLNTSVGYSHARYGVFTNAPCGNNQTISGGCNQLFSTADGAFHAQDLSGQQLVRAPTWSLNTGANYSIPVGKDLTVTLGANASYTSQYYTSIVELPNFVQPSYVKANASITLAGARDEWQVALIGNNLNDKVTAASCANGNMGGATVFGGQQAGKATGGPAGDDYELCAAERGRAVWLRVEVRPFEMLRH
jgi:iron complex outermembrane receptor protein